MPQFAANLSMLYPELAFLDRFDAAAKDGFKAVEYLFPYDFAKDEILARLKHNGLQQVLFNGPPGDWNGGERGLACLPGRDAEFREGIAKAIDYAVALDCPRIHVMAGLVPEGLERDVLIEPINTRDIPRFFLNRQDHAHEIVETVGAPNLKVQMDLYHCQIVEGDVAMKIRKYLPTGRVGHIQIAGVPERHEPDIGEQNYPYLFDVIDEVSAQCGWQGWVGCEYRPKRGSEPGGTSAGLGWLRAWEQRHA
jgi:hydroxypyruvate isomerase